MILTGDCLKRLSELPDKSVQTCITSPPYWGLRDYGSKGQLGLEKTPDEFVANLVQVFREVRRVLKDDGTLWLNLGDSYAASGKPGPNSGLSALADKFQPRKNKRNPNRDDIGSVDRPARSVPPGLKQKDLVGIPWRVAFALQADGWYLRQDIIWNKPNPMPESVRDRCTKAHEYIFLLSKSERYLFDHEAIKEPATGKGPGNIRPSRNPPSERSGQNANIRGSLHKIGARNTRNRRSVWTVTTKPFKGAHFATFPQDLVEPCVLAGSKPGDIVLDPFFGAGTTGVVALNHGRNYIGIELNKAYVQLAKKRLLAAKPNTEQLRGVV
jgi:DNA modification methylase